MSSEVRIGYEHMNHFHWQTDLSEERREELLAWVASLDDNQKRMLGDLLADCEDHVHGHYTDEDL